ncbi:hypothetical protein VCHA53O466_50256 [Vibrio chagasii]|nr:hypothetical protein VCHA53O466_50256 [Vibrio chagasii]
MNVSCSKCGEVLTSDLRPIKESKAFDEESAPSYSQSQHWMKKGVFFLTKSEKYNWTFEDSGIEGYYAVIKIPETLTVSHLSMVKGALPELDTGNGSGCCRVGHGAKLSCPKCSAALGTIHMDCMEDGSIRFNPKKVMRNYT